MHDPYGDELSIEQELEEQVRECGTIQPDTPSPLQGVADFFDMFGDWD